MDSASAPSCRVRPAPLAGCRRVVDDRIEVEWDAWPEGGGAWSVSYGDGILQGPGEPLEDVTHMTPKEVEAALQEDGLCYRFDHYWRPAPRFDDPRLDAVVEQYSDRRCSAPDSGEVTEVSFAPDLPSGKRGVIVYIGVRETQERDWPEPPPYGTDCPSQ
jgi:hypothetical protein